MRRFTALINPIAGGGRAAARLRPVTRLLEQAGAKAAVWHTETAAHAAELAETAAAAGNVVIAAGGDGLVRDVAGGVVAAGGTLAVVPAGRGNDFARALRLPREPHALAELLLDAPARTIDVLETGGIIVPGNVYAGIDSTANAMINSSRWMPAGLLYRLAPVRTILTWQPAEYTITADGHERRLRAHTVVVANSGAYGHGLAIVPQAVLDDGRADLLMVGASPRRGIVAFLRQAQTGAHLARPEVELASAQELVLDADRPLPVCADGDEIATLPVTVRVRPGALNILAPAAGPPRTPPAPGR